MLQLEQNLLNAFHDASLEFGIDNEKIQNQKGENICRLTPYYTIENYQPMLDILTALKAKIPDLEERVDDISINRISLSLDNTLSDDRNKLNIELAETKDESYNMTIGHDYVTTVYKENSFFWQADYITTNEQMTPTELSQYVEKMIDDIQTGEDIRRKQLTAFEKAGFKIHGSTKQWNIDKSYEVDMLPDEMNEDSKLDIALTEVVDDYIPHIYDLDGKRHIMIDALSFSVTDIDPAVGGTMFVPCDELENSVYSFVSDYKSFKEMCIERKTVHVENDIQISENDFDDLELESTRTL